MELQIEALPGWEVPKACFIGVRLGEALKQRRFDKTSANYYFPVPDSRKKAKIDLYKHVGTCCVPVDPDFRTSDEVNVACADPAFGDVKLRVTSQATQLSKEQESKRREAFHQETKETAVSYLAAHGIEQRLAESIRVLLKMQPEDPIEFLCQQLKAGGPTRPQVEKKPVPPPASSSVREPSTTWQKVSSFDVQGLGLPDCGEAERVLGKALLDFQGRYLPLPSSTSWPLMPQGMTPAESQRLEANGLLFQASDPRGRGVFISDAEDVAAWICAARHVQILIKPGSASDEVASKVQALRKSLEASARQHGYALVE